MKITSIKSYVLRYDLEKELGYSQQYYNHRTAHLVEIETDEGVTGWGECFGPGNIALANKFIVEKVIQPMILGENPLNKEYIWHRVYNLLRDSGQKGMPIQALSGIDIALWDILGKKTNSPLYQLIGGKCNNKIPVYGYGMMLQKKSVDELTELFKEEATHIKSKNFKAMKMKIGLGPKDDLKLVQSVREAIGKDFKLMVDANHAYNVNDALYVGKGLDEKDQTEEHKKMFELSDKLVKELKESDIIIISAPIYNYGPPATLKAWSDLAARIGETFRFKPNGRREGLLKNKHAYLVITSGGTKLNSSEDFLTPWLKFILNFFGIEKVDIISADQMALDYEKSIKEAETQIENLFKD